MRMKLLVGLVAGLFIVGMVGVASAASIFYNDSSTWNAAVNGVTTETYDTYGWSASGGDTLSNPVTLSGITYSFSGSQIFGIDANLNYDAAYHTTAYLEWQSSPNDFTITLPSAVTAISFDFGEFYGNSGVVFLVSLGNGDSTSASTLDNSYAFFGATSDTAFNTLTLNASGNFATIDNFSYGDAGNQPVPEPSTILLMGIGLLGLGYSRKRSKKS